MKPRCWRAGRACYLDELGVPFDAVRVLHGDTASSPFSLIGTGGSRSSSITVGATRFATRKIKHKALRIAAGMLEVAADDLWRWWPTWRHMCYRLATRWGSKRRQSTTAVT
jgi:CO/xanthine dehydrogenase Mo-binding subunit